jgi:hypothetical protein
MARLRSTNCLLALCSVYSRTCCVVDRHSGHTKGSSGVSGRTAIVGRTFPREVAVVLEESEFEVDNELEIDKELTCRAFKPGEEDEDLDGDASVAKERMVLEVKLGVIVDDGAASGIEVGIATGQKDQTSLS